MRAENDVAGALPTQRGLSLPVQVDLIFIQLETHDYAAGNVDECMRIWVIAPNAVP
jgi:hypothetical protein